VLSVAKTQEPRLVATPQAPAHARVSRISTAVSN
jgi:hypothetical protein